MLGINLQANEASEFEDIVVYPLHLDDAKSTIFQDKEDVYRLMRASNILAEWQNLEMPLSEFIEIARQADYDLASRTLVFMTREVLFHDGLLHDTCGGLKCSG